eukprot:CAMPEP_0194192014 /NCGR_PEP_ID=MMETSP0154-20130528/68972_1 /TAXON_ID=1049557 /ORGANISM="Thalassiothrix antarctica, Strain L6-D1" /LENGTH=76 /DNA_ID=CAMNT_0038915127 /DNA_START=203 /DNA_END=433 /DNA_ORIENTATION=+
MSASSVTHLNSIPNYNRTEERQVLDVDINNNMSFATILMKEDGPGGKTKILRHPIGYDPNWGVVSVENRLVSQFGE